MSSAVHLLNCGIIWVFMSNEERCLDRTSIRVVSALLQLKTIIIQTSINQWIWNTIYYTHGEINYNGTHLENSIIEVNIIIVDRIIKSDCNHLRNCVRFEFIGNESSIIRTEAVRQYTLSGITGWRLVWILWRTNRNIHISFIIRYIQPSQRKIVFLLFLVLPYQQCRHSHRSRHHNREFRYRIFLSRCSRHCHRPICRTRRWAHRWRAAAERGGASRVVHSSSRSPSSHMSASQCRMPILTDTSVQGGPGNIWMRVDPKLLSSSIFYMVTCSSILSGNHEKYR